MSENVSMIIPKVQLSNGLNMPQIGLGVWEVEDGGEIETTIATALSAGYRSIDTAMIYGNEVGVGNAVKNSDAPREELFITTKLWNTDHGYDRTLEAFDRSLSRLNLEFVDLYLVHWPVPGNGLMAETWRAMEQIYNSGRAKAIGVANFQPVHLKELLKTAVIIPMVDQIELHPRLPQSDLRTFCDKKGIVLTAWSPLQRGGDLLNNGTITQLADQFHKTPAQIVLRWHVQHGHTVIPKSVTPSRIKENIDIFDFELSQEAMTAIDQLENGEHVFEYSSDFVG